VTLINLSEGEKLSGVQAIMDRDEENGDTPPDESVVH
jgi:hypothetical protein